MVKKFLVMFQAARSTGARASSPLTTSCPPTLCRGHVRHRLLGVRANGWAELPPASSCRSRTSPAKGRGSIVIAVFFEVELVLWDLGEYMVGGELVQVLDLGTSPR